MQFLESLTAVGTDIIVIDGHNFAVYMIT